MALINYANKEINAKIVYYGPGLSGKTTNIQYVFQRLKPEHRGKLITLPTQTDRTLFFDFLPVEIPDVKGFTTRFHLYTVPGQVFYNATRKMVLKGVDGIVFVADSQKEKLSDNIDSLKNLEENLNEYGKSIKTIPFVFQFNKRDLTDISSPAELNKRLNELGYPSIEAIATTGKGVMERFRLFPEWCCATSKIPTNRRRYSGTVSRRMPAATRKRSSTIEPGRSSETPAPQRASVRRFLRRRDRRAGGADRRGGTRLREGAGSPGSNGRVREDGGGRRHEAGRDTHRSYVSGYRAYRNHSSHGDTPGTIPGSGPKSRPPLISCWGER